MSNQLALTRILSALEENPNDSTALIELDRIFERMITSDEHGDFEFGYTLVEKFLTSGSMIDGTDTDNKIAS